MYSLLLLSSLLHITTCTVYTVTPDDHYYPNTTCHHCHNLQHYLLNITKYFTSNTQLLFLPGLHHLHTHLIIQNVHNISLIGSTANGTTLDTVIIQCKSSVGIVMTNITNLTVMSIVINNCAADHSLKDTATTNESCFVLLNCFQVNIQHVTINYTRETVGLFALNVLGKFILNNVKSKTLKIVYNDSSYTNLYTPVVEKNELIVCKFQLISHPPTSDTAYWTRKLQHSSHSIFFSRFTDKHQENLIEFAVKFDLLQTSFNVTVKLKNSNFKYLIEYKKVITFTLSTCLSNIQNIIFIERCHFENNYPHYYLISIYSLQCATKNKGKEKNSIIKICNCELINNRNENDYLYGVIDIKDVNGFLEISECFFENNFANVLKFSSGVSHNSSVIITKSCFSSSIESVSAITVIDLANANLIFKGPVIYNGYKAVNLVETNTDITFLNYVEFSNNEVKNLIQGITSYSVHLVDNVYVNITNNHITKSIFSIIYETNVFYPFCYFQYYNIQNHTTKQTIFIESGNSLGKNFDDATANINCKWDPVSMYYGSNPLDVYTSHFQTVYEHSQFNTGLLCYCPDKIQPNCYTNVLKPLFPGQSLELHLALNPEKEFKKPQAVTVKMYDKDFPHSVCTISTLFEAEQLIEKNCTKVVYSIFSESQLQCKLILYNTKYKYPTVYYINLLNCPAGFSFDANRKKCICDPKLKSEIISINNCNINDQTILRPANSWISATTHNNSYTYHISLHCPFHYCLPHSSHLNFSTPNSQCQFNRSGLLCGHCQQGLSTVFGSSYCQNCSNVYISLTIVIAIAGVVFIFLMFILNLTVVDGTTNAFVFYANIISMNFSILFPKLDRFTPAYTFISLANLDLGIQTCFYNGMDDYAKMWLQLAFPFYLIFIATLIIITSHYSITIQRLTVRRALPVLATLFLLSYTKILRIVSSVLFFYSTITHIPSKHTTLVWSVDPYVPLFGVRFTILFIVCLILFLILIVFNVALILNKISPKLSFFIKYKSLFGTYEAPYKSKLYYWISLQLVLRTIFYGISCLERNANLTFSIILLSVIEGVQCVIKPFRNRALNYQELFFVLNALWLYAYILFEQNFNIVIVNVMIAMAAIHFFIIIMYHTITYVCGGVIIHKIWRNFIKLAGWITDKRTLKSATDQFVGQTT